jgi:hydroxyethylthiazole kinase
VTEENLDQMAAFAKQLSQKTGAVIAITGAIDIVASEKEALILRGGNALMSKITGTGCMLTAMTAAYVAANPGQKLYAVAAAVALMGLAGEKAYRQLDGRGTSTYRALIIDAISTMTGDELKEGSRFEAR